jgi:hypothetical protein
MPHESFTTITRGLCRSSPPMHLHEKAKKLGIWNPTVIDFSKDKADWINLKDDEKDLIWRLLAMFVAGEEAVTLDLLPFAIGVIGDAFAAYEFVPFGLVEDDFINYAMTQFSKRFAHLEKAKGQSLDEINRMTKQVIDAEDT